MRHAGDPGPTNEELHKLVALLTSNTLWRGLRIEWHDPSRLYITAPHSGGRRALQFLTGALRSRQFRVARHDNGVLVSETLNSRA